MSIKTLDVAFPPNGKSYSQAEADNIRNHRVDEMLAAALESGKIGLSDIDEYNELYHRLVSSTDATERARILKRMSIIDGSASGAMDTMLTDEDIDTTAPLKYFEPD